MKKSIKIISIIMILITILSIAGTSNAFSVSLKAESSSKLKAGNTVEVMLKITNIDAGNGIDAIGVALEYNKNIFDEVTRSTIEGQNDWYVGGYFSDTGIFTIQRDEKVNKVSNVVKITFRVKENVNVDSTEIKFKGISASGGAVTDGGTGDIIIPETSVIINKETITEQPPVVNTTVNETANEVANEVANTTTNTDTNTIKNPSTNTNKVANTTGSGSSTGKLPQTGENDIIMAIGISLIVIVAIAAFVKYRDLNIK